MIRRLVPLALVPLLLACSSDDGEDGAVAATTTTTAAVASSTTAAPADGSGTTILEEVGALCPTEQNVTDLVAYDMTFEEKRADGCKWGFHGRDPGRLDLTFEMTWAPISGVPRVFESGSSTSEANDSGHHRTARTLETTHYRWTLELIYDWDGRDDVKWEYGRDRVDAYVKILASLD